jgi:hypothetical protein
MLKTEVQVMREHLRRLEPTSQHIYGHFTQQLNQQQPPSQPQTNGAGGISLPPLNSTQAPGPGHAAYGAGAAPAAMEGVSYGSFGR